MNIGDKDYSLKPYSIEEHPRDFIKDPIDHIHDFDHKVDTISTLGLESSSKLPYINTLNTLEKSIPEIVSGPFLDFRILENGSTPSEEYWEVNGRRMTAAEYQRKQGYKVAHMFGIEPDVFEQLMDRNKTKQTEDTMSSAWLQSNLGASQRAVISPERAEFITQHIPLAVLFTLDEEAFEEIREALTSFDMMKQEEKDQIGGELQRIARKYDIQQINTDTNIEGSMDHEETYVLAMIRSDMLKGVEGASVTFELFKKQVQERQKLSLNKLLGSKVIIHELLNFSLKINDINNKILSQADLDLLLAGERIKEYRGQYKALFPKSSKNESTGNIQAERELYEKSRTQASQTTKKADETPDKIMSTKGHLVRQLNGHEQVSRDGGVTWTFTSQKKRAQMAETKKPPKVEPATYIDSRDTKPDPNAPLVLANPEGGVDGGTSGNYEIDNTPVVPEEPNKRPGK